MRDLLARIVEDGGKLLSQQFELFRAEVRDELRRAVGAAGLTAAGGGLVAIAGFLSGQMIAHQVHRATGLPLWASYGVAAGALGATGAALLRAGGAALADVQLLLPPQTAEAMKENLTWLKDQLTPAAS
jgi:hypothetical protein